MEKKTGCRRRIVIKEDFIFVGVCGHVTGAWWAPWGPGLSIFRFRRPYATFSSCRNLSGIQFKCRSEGGYFHGHRPSQPGLSSRCGMGRWSESQPWRQCAHKWGPGPGTKMGKERAKQRRNYLHYLLSSPELLLILVGWFPNNMQRLTRIQKQNTRRRYNLMSQALMVPYFNDWLGWFYPGYSGFHPQKKIWYKKRTKEKENFTLFLTSFNIAIAK